MPLAKAWPEDAVEAYKWWDLAAAQGEEGAETNKGILCRKNDQRTDRRSPGAVA